MDRKIYAVLRRGLGVIAGIVSIPAEWEQEQNEDRLQETIVTKWLEAAKVDGAINDFNATKVDAYHLS